MKTVLRTDGQINEHQSNEDTENQWTHGTHFSRPIPNESAQGKATSSV